MKIFNNQIVTNDGLVLNLVTCGYCGIPFAHTIDRVTLTCPYCSNHGAICEFPDLYINQN